MGAGKPDSRQQARIRRFRRRFAILQLLYIPVVIGFFATNIAWFSLWAPKLIGSNTKGHFYLEMIPPAVLFFVLGGLYLWVMNCPKCGTFLPQWAIVGMPPKCTGCGYPYFEDAKNRGSSPD